MKLLRILMILALSTTVAIAAPKKADKKVKQEPAPAQQEPAKAAPTQSMQFILTAESGTLRVLDETQNKYSLTLDNTAKNVMFFTAPPARVSSSIATEDFLKNWDGSKNTFNQNPPNAAIIFHTINNAEQSIRVIELVNPQHDLHTGKIIFIVKAVDGKPLDIRAALINPIITLSATLPCTPEAANTGCQS